MKNVYRKYESMQILHGIISLPLSFTAISIMYLLISLTGYYNYGLSIFNYHWVETPTFWQSTRGFLSHTFSIKFCLFAVIGFIADANAWPYFYRLKSATLEYEREQDSELESESTSESLND